MRRFTTTLNLRFDKTRDLGRISNPNLINKICDPNLKSESEKNYPKLNLESRIRILGNDKPESESRCLRIS